jgi:hypothetical protein
METDKIRHGIDYWITKARERGGDTLVTQLHSMIALMRKCEHEHQHEAGAHTVCLTCKWARHKATDEWEPVGFGR